MPMSLPDLRWAKKTASFLAMTVPGTRHRSLGFALVRAAGQVLVPGSTCRASPVQRDRAGHAGRNSSRFRQVPRCFFPVRTRPTLSASPTMFACVRSRPPRNVHMLRSMVVLSA
jgi:hypothetical protein